LKEELAGRTAGDDVEKGFGHARRESKARAGGRLRLKADFVRRTPGRVGLAPVVRRTFVAVLAVKSARRVC
jgi:hypothetical protein